MYPSSQYHAGSFHCPKKSLSFTLPDPCPCNHCNFNISKTNLSVLVQDSNARGSWTHFISQIHQIYSYIWNNFHWIKTQTSWATPTRRANEQNPTLKQVQEVYGKTQYHHKLPHPKQFIIGREHTNRASPWGGRILTLHLAPDILRPALEK